MPKKKTALTIEERLQQALVPAEEQPYEVPENWVWVRLGEVTKVVGGGTPSTSKKEYYDEGNISWLSPVDLSNYNGIYISRGNKMITLEGLNNSSAKLLPKDTVCLTSRAPIGYVAIAEKELCTNQGFKSFLPSPTYLAKFLYWYLKGNKELLESKASGTTFLELSASKAATIEFPLPPLSEQQRIVERIEELFAKLDEAKERLQEVVDSFAVRKAAILHKAFTGELTQQWRRENGVSDESWEEKKFSEVAVIKSNLVSPFDYLDYPHIAPDSIEKFTGRLLSYRTIREDNVKSPKHLFYKGQILYSKIRPYLSKAIIADVDGLCSADMYPIEALCNTKYLLKYMLSTEFLEQSTTAGSRSLLPKINQKELSSISVPLPTLPEQDEIVRLIDDLLARENSAQQATEQALASIDLMKKSILARAFRGELGTNKASEASALELLRLLKFQP